MGKIIRDCKIIGIRPTKIIKKMFKIIKIHQPGDSEELYKITLERREKKKEQFSVVCGCIYTQIILQNIDYTKKHKSLRELEDEVARIAIEKHEAEATKLSNQDDKSSYPRIISYLHEKDPELFLKLDLSLALESFENVPGFSELLKKIVMDRWIPSTHKNSDFGHVFELICAQRLKSIKAFSPTYCSSDYSAEFDLETTSGELIECKLSEKALNRDRRLQQDMIAKHHNKNFVVYISKKLSNNMKQWFRKGSGKPRFFKAVMKATICFNQTDSFD